MNSLEPDYKILYRLQDKFLQWWVSQKLPFPVEWLKTIKSLNASIDMANYQRLLEIIADDFLFGKYNSLGVNRIDIEQAQPRFFQR